MNDQTIVILDNYDSFTYNLYQMLGHIVGRAPAVFRNDRVDLAQLVDMRPTHLVISPGPGTPEDPAYFGVCRQAIEALGPEIPLLGVCLGHQGIACALGGRVRPADRPMHGKTSDIEHDGSFLFAGVPSPATVMRYHSLVVDEATLPTELQVTSRTRDGLIMSFAHRTQPIVGVQFHPESVGTEHGARMLRNFVGHTW